MSPQSTTSTVVVHSDEIEGIGRQEVARRAGLTEVVVGGPSEVPALVAGTDGPVRVVLFVTPDHRRWDRYAAIEEVAEAAAATAGASGRPWSLTPVADPHLNPLVLLRLQRVGAPVVASRPSVAGTEGWIGFLAGTVEAMDLTDTRRALQALAVGPRCDPAAALRWVTTKEWEAAFRPGVTQAGSGLTRRQALRLRREVSRLGDLRVPPTRWGGGPDRNVDLPYWRDVVDFVNLARGASTTVGELRSSSHESHPTDFAAPMGRCG